MIKAYANPLISVWYGRSVLDAYKSKIYIVTCIYISSMELAFNIYVGNYVMWHNLGIYIYYMATPKYIVGKDNLTLT